MSSFFKKLRKLLEASKEDYLTEILAYSLEHDSVFRGRFLKLLSTFLSENKPFTIETQCAYLAERRRTDLEINLGHTHIIIECKLGSTESMSQLDDYAHILSKKSSKNKLLVFLTANREAKTKDYSGYGVGFQQIRWYDIGHCIDDECDTITKEFKYYLKEEKIIMDKISYGDIVNLQSFFTTRKKLNDILANDVSRLFVEKGLYKYNIFQPTIRTNEYVLLLNYGKHFNIALGFGNWWGEHPCLFTRMAVSRKRDEKGKTAKSIHQKLVQAGWYFIETDTNYFAVEYRKPLLDFLQYEENQREHLVAFFEKTISDLVGIQADYPEIFNKSEKPVEQATVEE